MGSTVTLTELLAGVRQKADKVGLDNRNTDAIVTSFINDALGDIYSLKLKYAPDNIVTYEDTSTDGSSQTYALPSDHYILRNVELVYSTQEVITIFPGTFQERNLYKSAYGLQEIYGPYLYTRQGDDLQISPVLPSSKTLRIWYIPERTRLVSGTDTYSLDGDERDAVEWLSVIPIKIRDEESIQEAMFMSQKATKRVEDNLRRLDSGAPRSMPNFRHIRRYPSRYWR